MNNLTEEQVMEWREASDCLNFQVFQCQFIQNTKF